MNYNELIEMTGGFDLNATSFANRCRFLKLALRASMTLEASKQVEPKFEKALEKIAWSLHREAAELAESFRWCTPNIARSVINALRSTAAERLDRSIKRGHGAVIFCGRHKLAARILEVVK